MYSQRVLNSIGLVQPSRGASEMAYVLGKPVGVDGAPPPLFVQGLPMIKPSYGQITAIDMNQGDILWQIAHGERRITCATIPR